MKHTKLKEVDYFIAWILFFLGSTIVGAVTGGVFGAVMGFILGTAGVGLQSIKVAAAILGFIIGLPISYLAFRFIVAKFIVDKVTK